MTAARAEALANDAALVDVSVVAWLKGAAVDAARAVREISVEMRPRGRRARR